jgi:signal peptidase I
MPVMTEAREAHKLDLAAEVLSWGGTIRLQALGTSMLPSIWPGDVLNIENKPGEDMVPGDIVLVARENRFVVHRLVEKHHTHWITRGDSLPQNDAAVAEVQVLGKVSTIHRKSRVIIPSPQVSLLVGALAGMLCHWDRFRTIALRIHSFWQHRASLGPSSRKAGRRISSIASATCAFETNEAFLPDRGE